MRSSALPVEVLGAKPLTSGAETEWDVVPEMQVTLSQRQHVRVGGGFLVPQNDYPNRAGSLVFYVLWDWFDGRIGEGWQGPPPLALRPRSAPAV